jgi:maleylpyruvate isomerase
VSGPPELGHVAASEARLLTTVEPLTDEQATAPSALPGWSRAELVTHLARNADSHRRLAEAAMEGRVGTQYEGGWAERDAAIAVGRGRGAAEVKSDLARSVEWLHETWAAVPDEAWSRMAQMSVGPLIPLAQCVGWRWLEAEVHRVDLALGDAPASYGDDFVRFWLPRLVAHLPEREGGMPDARVVLWADDAEQAWEAWAREGAITVGRFDPEAGTPDLLVRGPAAHLVAYLLGRDAPALTVSGDPSITLPSFT